MNFTLLPRVLSRTLAAGRVNPLGLSAVVTRHRFASTVSKSSSSNDSSASGTGASSQTTLKTTTAAPSRQSAPKPKPNKSPSSLKRTASASQVIRSNPTPTRGAIRPVYTFATAERYDLSRIQWSLTNEAVQFEEALWIPLPTAPGVEGESEANEAWVFKNGTVVCWGLEEGSAKQFMETLLSSSKRLQKGPLKVVETEELEFVVDPAETTRLQGDIIILGTVPSLNDPELLPVLPSTPSSDVDSLSSSTQSSSYLPPATFPARYAFSQALARSTALSAFETSLDTFMSSVERLPQRLLETGKPSLERTEIIRKMGALLKFRQGLNLGRENFGDTPDFYWQEPVLEGYFDSMSSALEIQERIEVLNRKITYASEVQVTLRELLTESSGHRMEVIIIALIAVEVVIAIIRDGPELWEMVVGKPDQSKPKHSKH